MKNFFGKTIFYFFLGKQKFYFFFSKKEEKTKISYFMNLSNTTSTISIQEFANGICLGTCSNCQSRFQIPQKEPEQENKKKLFCSLDCQSTFEINFNRPYLNTSTSTSSSFSSKCLFPFPLLQKAKKKKIQK